MENWIKRRDYAIKNQLKHQANTQKGLADNYLSLAKKSQDIKVKLKSMAAYHRCMAEYNQIQIKIERVS